MRTNVDLTERLLDQLEGHGHERRIGIGGQRNFGPAVGVVLGEDLAVERAGQIAANGVQERLDALVAVRRADHDRTELLRDRPLANRLVNQVDRDLGLFEQELHDLVGNHRERFEHSLPGALGRIDHVGRESARGERLRLCRRRNRSRRGRSGRSRPESSTRRRSGSWSGMAVSPSLVSSCWITLAGLAPVRSILLMNAMRGTA